MSIFQQLIKSIYSPETIAKFRMAKIGRTIGYVFLLMLIASIPMIISISMFMSGLFQAGDQYLDDLPDFSIENGTLQSDEDAPVIDDDDDMTVIFDSTGELQVEDLEEYGNLVALLERELVFVAGANADVIAYQDFGIDFSKSDLTGFYSTLSDLSFLIIGLVIVVVYLFNTGLKFIGIFTLSLIALAMKSSQAPQLKYRHCWVLAAYTVTLPTLLFALLEALGILIPFQFVIYWVIAAVMMNLVLRHVPKPKEPQMPQ
ncbi:DUF1189 domain-containing protein [Alkalicoccus urumqiensis]|nr:DUF1189 domain-containing protein [Alkalicoccus urumqiensis]